MNTKFLTFAKAEKGASLHRCSLFTVHCSLSKFSVPCSFSPAFTLVELLVVVGILGILMAVLLPNFFGGRESARATLCLANLKTLGNAVQSYGVAESFYPRAGSVEYRVNTQAGASRTTHAVYHDKPGWISWNSQGKYKSIYGNASSSQNSIVGMYSTDSEASIYALTNGAIWTYVARNTQVYVCPSHVRKMKGKALPHWSYLMSSYFRGNSASAQTYPWGHGYASFPRADRFLLFSEVPFMGYSAWNPSGTGASDDTDAVLNYSGGRETIGANHVDGKNLYAHVCFADGHTEKFKIPYTGTPDHPKANETQLRNLTQWLCEGKDVSYNGSRYQKMTD